jgi:hypothetical protein
VADRTEPAGTGTPTHLVELVSGTGEPAYVELAPARVLDPTSVGTNGMWKLDAQNLYLQSADEMRPAIANGQAVARTWTLLEPPCTIDLGVARLQYRPIAVGIPDETLSKRPGQLRAAPRPFGPDELAPLPDTLSGDRARPKDDYEATRNEPVEAGLAARALQNAQASASTSKGKRPKAAKPSRSSSKPPRRPAADKGRAAGASRPSPGAPGGRARQ